MAKILTVSRKSHHPDWDPLSYDATRFVLHMNTFNSAINQPFYSYFSTLQPQFIATEQCNETKPEVHRFHPH